MVIDESVLRAYVDGELDPATREKVEAVVAHSPALQAQVTSLRASCLPYGTAFDAQALPPVPAALQKQVAAMAALAGSGSAPSTPPSTPNSARPASDRRRWLGGGLALAASFAAGALLPWRNLLQQQGSVEQGAWVAPIAVYHSLYVRETLDARADDPSRLAGLVSDWSGAQRTALHVPDLLRAGLEFKRVQRLGFGNTPLIQMVFLPASGKPVALCALPVSGADAPLALTHIEGLGVAHWRRDQLAYVLAAELPDAQLAQLAKGLVAGEFAKL
jgi:anti-sigma factor RsiW